MFAARVVPFDDVRGLKVFILHFNFALIFCVLVVIVVVLQDHFLAGELRGVLSADGGLGVLLLGIDFLLAAALFGAEIDAATKEAAEAEQ